LIITLVVELQLRHHVPALFAGKARLGALSLLVTFVIDDKYLNQLLFVLYQCAKNAIRDHEYVIFFKRLELTSISEVTRMAAILNVRVQLKQINDFQSSFDNGHIASASMLRLTVPHHLDKTYMHLDVDTLPLKGWDDIESFSPSAHEIISAVPIPSLHLEISSEQNEAVRVMGPDYFQTGIYLLNPENWDQNMISDRIRAAINEYSILGFQFSDQCILNYVIQKSYQRIPEAYNAFPRRFGFKSTFIIHFAGPNKPWQIDYLKHFINLFRHSLSARHTLSLLSKGEYRIAFQSFLSRFRDFVSEIYCYLLYKARYAKFKRSFLTNRLTA